MFLTVLQKGGLLYLNKNILNHLLVINFYKVWAQNSAVVLVSFPFLATSMFISNGIC